MNNEEVVAYAKVADGAGPHYSDGEIIEASTFEFTDRELGDKWRQIELVRRQDAELFIAKERSRKYDEGRQSKEEEMNKYSMRIDGHIIIEAENKQEAIHWIEDHGKHGKSELYMPVKELDTE
jgi:hypothetical protein